MFRRNRELEDEYEENIFALIFALIKVAIKGFFLYVFLAMIGSIVIPVIFFVGFVGIGATYRFLTEEGLFWKTVEQFAKYFGFN